MKEILKWMVLAAGVVAMVNTARADVEVDQADAVAPADVAYTAADAQGRYVFLVRFSEPGLIQAAGGGGNWRDAATGNQRLALRHSQAARIGQIASLLQRKPEVSHRFLLTHSGVAMRMNEAEATAVARLPGVVSVERERLEHVQTFRGPGFIGAEPVWDGTAVPGGDGTEGGGMVIAVLDTGVDPAHPAFANDPACGHGDTLPDKLIDRVDCSVTDINGLCNGPNPGDANGHGTHTASTAGGNRLGSDTTPPPDPPPPYTGISGVAPCASIRSYRVCPTNSCPFADLIAGINHAIDDAVDVINYSISGGREPWLDLDRLFLDAVDTGIFVAAAAGNTGPGAFVPEGAVNHLGPWVMSVAASTHDVPGGGLLSVTAPGSPPANLQNMVAMAGTHSPAAGTLADVPIRHFPDQNPNFEGCTPGEDGVPAGAPVFPADYFKGAAALIRRGTCSFTTKIGNAHAAGAVLVIISNNDFNPLFMNTADQPDIPAYSIGLSQGALLSNFVAANPDSTALAFEPISGDVLADFSLRGPTPAPLHNLTKPDISAPGVQILAAIPLPFGGYFAIDGTSMAAPHVAGAGTLLRAIHPDWSPMAVKSALQMTARRAGRKESLLHAWDWDDIGSGRIDVSRAVRAGLVMEETKENFLAANPDIGGNPESLNMPAVRAVDCSPECHWTRTVTSVLDEPAQWLVTPEAPPGFAVDVVPDSFTLQPGASQTLTIHAWPLPGEAGTQLRFGALNLETTEPLPTQHLTIAVRGTDRPIIQVNRLNVTLTVESGASAAPTAIISNPGTQELEWSIGVAGGGTCDGGLPQWLTIQPAAGNVAPGAAETITLAIDTTGLALGTHQAPLCIAHNDPLRLPVNLPVNVTVVEPVMAADLAVSLTLDGTPSETRLGYLVTVDNAGPRDVTGARVFSAFGSGVSGIQWTCQPEPGGDCPASGNGEINQFVDLAAGAALTFAVEAVPAHPAGGQPISSSVVVTVPDGLSDPVPGNNLAKITVLLPSTFIFRDRFEME